MYDLNFNSEKFNLIKDDKLKIDLIRTKCIKNIFNLLNILNTLEDNYLVDDDLLDCSNLILLLTRFVEETI